MGTNARVATRDAIRLVAAMSVEDMDRELELISAVLDDREHAAMVMLALSQMVRISVDQTAARGGELREEVLARMMDHALRRPPL